MLLSLTLLLPSVLNAQKPKLPKPRVLERSARFQRDSATGELRLSAPGAPSISTAEPAIRSRVTLVEVNCTVSAPDGTPVRGLVKDDFRLFENGAEQSISSFDAAETPANIAIVLDASPSIYRELTQMREAAQSLSRSLKSEDEVAVVAFADQTELLLPFSRDRNLLSAALDSSELARVANSSESYIYEALYLTAHDLFADRPGRKAILLVTDGEDSGLGLNWAPSSMQPRPGTANQLAFEDVAREIAAAGIELYVISTENRPRAMTESWLMQHQTGSLITPAARSQGMPQYTVYLAEMVRQVGGELYFLRELGGLARIYRRIALTLGAEYTLGYYPSAGVSQPGWRSMRVDLRANAPEVPSGARIAHRSAYYVPASP